MMASIVAIECLSWCADFIESQGADGMGEEEWAFIAGIEWATRQFADALEPNVEPIEYIERTADVVRRMRARVGA